MAERRETEAPAEMTERPGMERPEEMAEFQRTESAPEMVEHLGMELALEMEADPETEIQTVPARSGKRRRIWEI